MKKLNDILYILTLSVSAVCLLSGCEEYEMKAYSEAPAINFVGLDNRGQIAYEPATLFSDYNFGVHLRGDSVQVDTIRVIVRLQGAITHDALNIKLKAEPVDGYPVAEVAFMDHYQIDSSAYQDTLAIQVKRPAEWHTEYKTRIVFDYAASDVVAGVDTLQGYTFTVTDALTMEMLKLTESDWYWDFNPDIGAYSETKARFMVMTLKTLNFYTSYWGLSAAHIAALRTALIQYNEANPGNPLRDEEGNLISFEP